jgi:hypothetical protein
MNHFIKSIASWTVFLVMLIQFVPLNRINPPVTRYIPAPPTVKSALKKACYDCHSNETRWQGIAYIAPFSWLTSFTVDAGRKALNFSAWNNEPGGKSLMKNPEILDSVSKAGSHYWYYYLWNPGAKLSDSENARLSTWFSNFEKEQQADIKNSEHSRQDKTP